MRSNPLLKAGRWPPPAPHKQGAAASPIVVLPFANMSGDPEQDYFVDGVTESLTTDYRASTALS